ncbi:MAG: DegT/DnrJ/EryC1/StrS aminotransferase family protein [Alphaproteobacteria bacterium]|nr:DegT/DnrJ/EryC1/StrS aminotransferase family protein [Alphaproteobacteria bacterium]
MSFSVLSKFSEHQGVRAHSWLYFRARVALFHTLRAMGVGPGDEVALQAFTCVAVPEAILAAGARPIWVDIVPGGVNMDPRSLAERITPRTKAVVVQHTFGIPAAVPALAAVIAGSRARLIEDCCHAFGSVLSGRELGTFGSAAFWSFEWGKPVIAGVGGALMVNDPELAVAVDASYESDFRGPPLAREAILRAQGLAHRILYSPHRYWSVRRAYRSVSRAGIITPSFNELPQPGCPGPEYSLRMSRTCAGRLPRALALARGELPGRREQAALYSTGIEPRAAGRATVPAGSREVLSRFPLLVSNKAALLAAFAKANLELADFFSTPVHPLEGSALRAVGFEAGSCPVAEATAKQLVSLPLGGKVSRTFQEAAVRLVNEHGKC